VTSRRGARPCNGPTAVALRRRAAISSRVAVFNIREGSKAPESRPLPPSRAPPPRPHPYPRPLPQRGLIRHKPPLEANIVLNPLLDDIPGHGHQAPNLSPNPAVHEAATRETFRPSWRCLLKETDVDYAGKEQEPEARNLPFKAGVQLPRKWQVAILTERINNLDDHFNQTNQKKTTTPGRRLA